MTTEQRATYGSQIPKENEDFYRNAAEPLGIVVTVPAKEGELEPAPEAKPGSRKVPKTERKPVRPGNIYIVFSAPDQDTLHTLWAKIAATNRQKEPESKP